MCFSWNQYSITDADKGLLPVPFSSFAEITGTLRVYTFPIHIFICSFSVFLYVYIHMPYIISFRVFFRMGISDFILFATFFVHSTLSIWGLSKLINVGQFFKDYQSSSYKYTKIYLCSHFLNGHSHCFQFLIQTVLQWILLHTPHPPCTHVWEFL